MWVRRQGRPAPARRPVPVLPVQAQLRELHQARVFAHQP